MFFTVTFMTSIPDSFKMSDLTDMLENAPSEDELHTAADNSDKEFTPEFIEDVAQEALEFATNKCADPLVHKVMAMTIMHRMIEWHKGVAKSQLDDGELLSMGAWMRDAGKFQAVMDILVSIAIGPNDFTCNHE